MCSSVVISTGFISEYIILSRSTTVHMEVGPHHSSSQGRAQNLMENHRPEKSLTCIVCKIAGAVVRTRVVDVWSDLDLFNPDQFAYLRGRSTLAQLLTCYTDWAKARNRLQQTDIIFLDVSKAFDSVPHERLLLKLLRHGIDGSLLLWIRNFLTC